MNCRKFVVALACAGLGAVLSAQAAEPVTVFAGTYTGKGSEGIYALRLDPETGKLESAGLAARADNPSFLARRPGTKFLYAVSEIASFGGKPGGAVAAYAVDPVAGRLTELNRQPTGGAAPCHLAVSPSGRYVVVANYSDGNAALFPILDDGRLGPVAQTVQHQGSGPNLKRQTSPHAHGVTFDASGRYVFVPDLGIDRIMIYELNEADGHLTPHEPPFAAVAPGAGPRHFVFHPKAPFAYVVNEMASTVTAFAWDAAKGRLETIASAGTLPEGWTNSNTTAELAVHPSGRFLYASNRGHDSIAVFAIDVATGRLTPVQHQASGGRTPRSFTIDPSGRFLLTAHQDSGNVCSFRIDPDSGRLTPTGSEVPVAKAVCLVCWEK